ncbi:hypothetical protein CCP4SC76_3290004 [Gammaproteobacteria bacterium]
MKIKHPRISAVDILPNLSTLFEAVNHLRARNRCGVVGSGPLIVTVTPTELHLCVAETPNEIKKLVRESCKRIGADPQAIAAWLD